jgi:ABC-type nickel/cobalt efflux system permease component RcnA
MTTLISVLTLILVGIIALWAAWPRLRAWIEQPKYDVLRQIREYEDAHAKTEVRSHPAGRE